MKNASLIMAYCLFLVVPASGDAAAESKPSAVAFLPEGKSVSAQVIRSTGPLLKPLGTRPLIGRDFLKEDFEPQTPAVAIISFSLWAAATDSRPDIIGHKIQAGDQEFVVVAVAPKSPAPLAGMKVWLATK